VVLSDFKPDSGIQFYLIEGIQVKNQPDAVFERTGDGVDISGNNDWDIYFEEVPQTSFNACFTKER